MCPKQFWPRTSFATCCSQRCAMKKGKQEKAANLKAAKDKVKSMTDLHKEAQKEFNKWVRLRDAQLPCISCGAPPPDLSGLHAGRDAGHYRSVASAKHLRYDPSNVNAQCVHCNQWGAGNSIGYRRGLLERNGAADVDRLECDNQVKKWKEEEVIAIRDKYRALAKALKGAA